MEIAGQAAPDPTPEPEEKKNAPPPPPGIPPTGNCLKYSTQIRVTKKYVKPEYFKTKKKKIEQKIILINSRLLLDKLRQWFHSRHH